MEFFEEIAPRYTPYAQDQALDTLVCRSVPSSCCQYNEEVYNSGIYKMKYWNYYGVDLSSTQRGIREYVSHDGMVTGTDSLIYTPPAGWTVIGNPNASAFSQNWHCTYMVFCIDEIAGSGRKLIFLDNFVNGVWFTPGVWTVRELIVATKTTLGPAAGMSWGGYMATMSPQLVYTYNDGSGNNIWYRGYDAANHNWLYAATSIITDATMKANLDLQQVPAVSYNNQKGGNQSIIAWVQGWSDGKNYPAYGTPQTTGYGYYVNRVTAADISFDTEFPSIELNIQAAVITTAVAVTAGVGWYTVLGFHNNDTVNGDYNLYSTLIIRDATTHAPLSHDLVRRAYYPANPSSTAKLFTYPMMQSYYDESHHYYFMDTGSTKIDWLLLPASWQADINGNRWAYHGSQFAYSWEEESIEKVYTVSAIPHQWYGINTAKYEPPAPWFICKTLTGDCAQGFATNVAFLDRTVTISPGSSYVYPHVTVRAKKLDSPLFTLTNDNNAQLWESLDSGETWERVDGPDNLDDYLSTAVGHTISSSTSPRLLSDADGKLYLLSADSNDLCHKLSISSSNGVTWLPSENIELLVNPTEDPLLYHLDTVYGTSLSPDGTFHLSYTNDDWMKLFHAMRTPEGVWSVSLIEDFALIEVPIDNVVAGDVYYGEHIMETAPNNDIFIFHWTWWWYGNYCYRWDHLTQLWSKEAIPGIEDLYSANYEVDTASMVFDDDGTLYLAVERWREDNNQVYVSGSIIEIFKRTPGGVWSLLSPWYIPGYTTDTYKTLTTEAPALSLSEDGFLHFFFNRVPIAFDPNSGYYGDVGTNYLVYQKLDLGAGTWSTYVKYLKMLDYYKHCVDSCWNENSRPLSGAGLIHRGSQHMVWTPDFLLPDALIQLTATAEIDIEVSLKTIVEMRTDPLTNTAGHTNPMLMSEDDLIPTGHEKIVYRKIWCKNTHPTETIHQLTLTHIETSRTYGTAVMAEAIGNDFITEASGYTYDTWTRLIDIAPGEEKAFWLKWSAVVPTVGGSFNEINLRVEIA